MNEFTYRFRTVAGESTVTDLCKKVGVGGLVIRKMLDGKYTGNARTLPKVAKFLGVSVDEVQRLLEVESKNTISKTPEAKRNGRPAAFRLTKEQAIQNVIRAIAIFKTEFAGEDLKAAIAEIKAKKLADFEEDKKKDQDALDAKLKDKQAKLDAEVSTLAAVEAVAQ